MKRFNSYIYNKDTVLYVFYEIIAAVLVEIEDNSDTIMILCARVVLV
jgi:hypothetical protein